MSYSNRKPEKNDFDRKIIRKDGFYCTSIKIRLNKYSKHSHLRTPTSPTHVQELPAHSTYAHQLFDEDADASSMSDNKT